MSEDNWLNALPEELRDAPYLAKAETPAEALGKLQHAAQLVGTSVRIPGENASDEDRAAFTAKLSEIEGVTQLPLHDDIEGVVGMLKKLGYPDEHTGYTLPIEEDFEWSETMGEDLRKFAHKAGLTPGQFTAFSKQIMEQEKIAAAESSNELGDTQKALRANWGDTLEDREALIRGWMDKSEAPQNLRKLLDERSLDVDTMNWLHNTAKQFKSNVTPITSDGKSNAPAMTPGEASAKITNILNDMTSMRESDPRYRELQMELVRVQRLASAR
jgi:hypothetical protein